MNYLVSRLVVYKNLEAGQILRGMADICRRFEEGFYNKEELISDIYTQVHNILELGTRCGFDKNLWHNYLAYCLAMTECPFTLVAEKAAAPQGTVNQLVRGDLKIFYALLHYDFAPIEAELDINCFTLLTNYTAAAKPGHVVNANVSAKVRALSNALAAAPDADALYKAVTDFYHDNGVGKLGLNKAFRLNVQNDSDSSILVPITNTADVQLEDLVGYELQKQRLVANTEAFVSGRQANNLLLYGDAGTGKSTSIKAILNKYYPQGLRMIELYKHEAQYLSRVIDKVKNRNYRFIIYMDDLSFEEFEVEYKYLKAVIEGGLEAKPENVLIYATSNRRHLIRETWGDRSDMSQDELHRSDTMQEKLSLAARFGESIGYFKPTQKEYLHIVEVLAAKYPQLKLSGEALRSAAIQWEMSHSGATGRTAQQFINHLLGMIE